MLDWKQKVIAGNTLFSLKYGTRELVMGMQTNPAFPIDYKIVWETYDDTYTQVFRGVEHIDYRSIVTKKAHTKEFLELFQSAADKGMIAMFYMIAEKYL